MEHYEKFLLGLSLWTLMEGSWIFSFPKASVRLSKKLFPSFGRFLEEVPSAELRKYGLIEFAFGALLGVYLWIAT